MWMSDAAMASRPRTMGLIAIPPNVPRLAAWLTGRWRS
jgi:hypothetical protein